MHAAQGNVGTVQGALFALLHPLVGAGVVRALGIDARRTERSIQKIREDLQYVRHTHTLHRAPPVLCVRAVV